MFLKIRTWPLLVQPQCFLFWPFVCPVPVCPTFYQCLCPYGKTSLDPTVKDKVTIWLLLLNCDSVLRVAKPEIPVVALWEHEYWHPQCVTVYKLFVLRKSLGNHCAADLCGLWATRPVCCTLAPCFKSARWFKKCCSFLLTVVVTVNSLFFCWL